MSRLTDRSDFRFSVVRLCAVLMTVALLSALLPIRSVDAATIPTFTLQGVGYGHGLGMSQEGALQMAREGKTSTDIIKQYFTDVKLKTLGSSPRALVNLDSGKAARSSWTLSPGYASGKPSADNAGDTLQVVSGSTTSSYTDLAGPYQFKVASGVIAMYSVKTSKKLATFGTSVQVKPAVIDPGADLLTVVDGSGPFGHANIRYRGYLKLTVSGTKLKLVNSVSMQHYLYGVVPREIGNASDATMAAAEAQALCARSYAYPKASAGKELACSTSDQVYGGHSRFTSEANRKNNKATAFESAKSNAAIDATNNCYVAYKDKVVAAYFAACNGNASANSEDVWGSKLGYLRSRVDPWCAKSHKDHAWTVKVSGLALAKTLKTKGVTGAPSGAGSSVFVTDVTTLRGDGGWVKSAVITWSNGASSQIALADNVRIKFGLRSANFTISNSLKTSTSSGKATKPAADTLTTYQENNKLIKRTKGKWKRVSHAKFSGKKAYRSSSYKGKITLRFKGTGVIWYGQTSAGGGRAKVYLDGKYKKTIQLKSSKTVRVKKIYE
ncbi:MAG: SpoIID/LytB domain-containing protein, partial [Actinomycetes bacterium]|nr:SpoIID/LytB domain-containing protein [Actinomycetes bacterium]